MTRHIHAPKFLDTDADAVIAVYADVPPSSIREYVDTISPTGTYESQDGYVYFSSADDADAFIAHFAADVLKTEPSGK